MAIPKNVRTITVNDQEYYYTVRLEFYCMTIQTHVGMATEPNRRFCLIAQQGDPHLKDVERHRIGVITPGLVAKAIKLVLEKTTWATEKQSVTVSFIDNELSVQSSL